MESHTAVENNELLCSAAAWTDLETTMLSEIRQSEEDKYHMVYSHVESNGQNTPTNKTRGTDTWKRRTDAEGRGWG